MDPEASWAGPGSELPLQQGSTLNTDTDVTATLAGFLTAAQKMDWLAKVLEGPEKLGGK